MITLATRRPKVPRADVLDGGSAARRKPAPSAAGDPVRKATPGGATPRAAKVTDLAEKARAKSAPKSGESRPASRPASSGVSARGASTGGSAKGGKGKTGAKEAPAAEPTPVPARAFSGRLLALGLVMVAITILLAPTVKNWWDQRQQISQLQADIRSRQTEQDDLKKEISRWHDPAYVQQQARDRINMVMPGETGYWVFGKDGGTAGTPAAQPSGAASTAGQPAPWTQKFLDSVREATK